MVTEQKFSKDVLPQARQRVGEAANRSLLASKVAMQALALDSDPLFVEIARVARQLPALSRERALVTLDLFALLERCAEMIERSLADAATPEARRLVWLDFEAAVGRAAPLREVAEAMSVSAMLNNPKYARTYFQEGMACVRMKWPLATTTRDKQRFVEMCLESDKGYSKTLRTIPDWQPASQATLASIVKAWLEGESNTSIFTNDPLDGVPQSRVDQISTAYAAASGDPSKAPDEDALRTMWSALLLAVSDQKDLRLSKEALRGIVSQQSSHLIGALRVLPDAAAKVNHLAGDGFDDVYAILMPPAEPVDAEFMLARRKQDAARLARWIQHIDHALPHLKAARFAKGSKASYSLSDQLKAFEGDPSLTASAAGKMELLLLKADIARRARERLGGPEVDLSSVDPRRLDGALFVAELRAQFMTELRRAEASSS